jgi:hypothetical protein
MLMIPVEIYAPLMHLSPEEKARSRQYQRGGTPMGSRIKIPRHTGHDMDNPGRPENEHFGNCRSVVH